MGTVSLMCGTYTCVASIERHIDSLIIVIVRRFFRWDDAHGPSTSTSRVRPTKRLAARARAPGAGRPRRAAPSGPPTPRWGTWSAVRRRLSPSPRREDEREGAVEADLLAHLERLEEVLLGLPREPDDDVRGDRHVGDVLAQQRDAVHEPPAVVRAAHGLEDAAGAGLQRQMHVLADARQVRVRTDHVLPHVRRCGLVYRMRSRPSIVSSSRSSSANERCSSSRVP